MGIHHFENGKELTKQYVDTGVKLTNISAATMNGLGGTRTFTVPVKKKWNVHKIMASRDEPGTIKITLKSVGTPSQTATLDQDGTGYDVIIDDGFTIGAGWAVAIIFGASVNPGDMFPHIIYAELAE